MPAKILELRRKISSTFNHSDSLTYVRTNWAAIDGKPTLFPPAAHNHDSLYVAKVTNTSSYSQVYGKATNGSQTMYNLSSSAAASTIPTRDANGQLIVKEVPTANNHAASKEYVDTLVNSSKYSEVGATITSGKTLNINDANKFFPVASSSMVTISIPQNSSVPFPIGTEIHFLRRGSGDVSFSPNPNVSLLSHNSRRKISAINQMVTLKKIETDQWVLIGALKA